MLSSLSFVDSLYTYWVWHLQGVRGFNWWTKEPCAYPQGDDRLVAVRDSKYRINTNIIIIGSDKYYERKWVLTNVFEEQGKLFGKMAFKERPYKNEWKLIM